MRIVHFETSDTGCASLVVTADGARIHKIQKIRGVRGCVVPAVADQGDRTHWNRVTQTESSSREKRGAQTVDARDKGPRPTSPPCCTHVVLVVQTGALRRTAKTTCRGPEYYEEHDL